MTFVAYSFHRVAASSVTANTSMALLQSLLDGFDKVAAAMLIFLRNGERPEIYYSAPHDVIGALERWTHGSSWAFFSGGDIDPRPEHSGRACKACRRSVDREHLPGAAGQPSVARAATTGVRVGVGGGVARAGASSGAGGGGRGSGRW